MKERAEAMVLASFVADAHALGVHRIYDTDEIATRFGRVERLLPAPPDSRIGGRPAGSATEYGDSAFVLLQRLAADGGFALDRFADDAGSLLAGCAGCSQDDAPCIAAAARIAPLAYLYRDDLPSLIGHARSQASLTNGVPLVADVAEFLARVVWHVLNGKTPIAALRHVSSEHAGTAVRMLVESGIASADVDTVVFARRVGQDCVIDSALPLTVHLIAKYEGSLREALVQNAAAGGDGASRGMITGMVIGAFHGREAIPDDWLAGLRRFEQISRMLEDLESGVARNGAQ